MDGDGSTGFVAVDNFRGLHSPADQKTVTTT